MLVQLKYKNDVIPGFFISDEGKIYDAEGVEQELKIFPSHPYYHFKSRKVHKLMAHSFFGYKEGFDVHHKNQVKTDNRLQNLIYLTRAEHRSLHGIGNKNWLGRKHSEQSKAKMCAAQHKNKKPVYCVELDRVFGGVSIAAKELSLLQSRISLCCQGKRKTTGGYHWQYYKGEQK